jgi:pimeloyl-ACP methyl ester carboxylesterase
MAEQVRQSTGSVELETPVGRFTADVAGPGTGRAPVVLLLHGFPQTRHTWRAQLPALAEAGYRAVAPDQRGYSAGARPDPATDLDAYAIARLTADVLDLAEAAGCRPDDRFHLVGHDWGGMLAWVVAAHHPERLATLAVLSRPHPAAFRRAMRDDAGDQQHRSRHHRAFLDPATGPKLLADGARRLRRNLRDAGVPADACDLYLSVLGQPAALEAALAWYRAAAGDLGRIEVGPVSVPTLYVWGDADASVSAEAARWTAEQVTGPYRFEALPGVGHFATDQAPEAVTRLLVDHLRAHPARPGPPGE